MKSKRNKRKILCDNCHKHEATVEWVGDGGILDHMHGFYKMWCERCTIKAQLKYAREQAARIPELEKEYAKFRP